MVVNYPGKKFYNLGPGGPRQPGEEVKKLCWKQGLSSSFKPSENTTRLIESVNQGPIS
jgi:hypothetical protein